MRTLLFKPGRWIDPPLRLLVIVALLLGTLPWPTAQAAPLRTPGSAPTAPTAAPNWVFQGPAPEINAQQSLVDATGAALPGAQQMVTGAIWVIAASPTNADVVYVGGVNGGVWKTTNATAAAPTWTPLTDNLKSLSIGAMAFDPTDTTGQTLVVGTGRFSGKGYEGDDLAGLYYTTDGGTTWAVTSGTNNNLATTSITGVAARGSTFLVSTNSPATSSGGLYRTTGGLNGTWTQIAGTGGLPNAGAKDIVADPANPNTLYVTFLGAAGGIWKTTDLGATWSNVTNGIPVSSPTAMGFGISANTTFFNAAVFNNGTTNVVYVTLSGTNMTGVTGTAQVSSATASGTTATITTVAAHGLSVGQRVTIAGVSVSGYNGAFTIVSVPSSTTFTYVVTTSSLANATGGTVSPSEGASAALYRSVNGAAFTALDVPTGLSHMQSKFAMAADKTNPDLVYVGGYSANAAWRVDASKPSGSQVTQLEANPSTTTPTYGSPHADNCALAVNANGNLLLGSHGGLFMLPAPASPASATNFWVSKNGNLASLAVTEIVSLAYDNLSHVLVAGLPDNGTVSQNAQDNIVWTRNLSYGDGQTVAVDTATLLGSAQSIRYGSSQLMGSFARNLFNAANVGPTVKTISTSPITDKLWQAPVALNAVNPLRMLIGGSGHVYEDLATYQSGAFADAMTSIAAVGASGATMAYGGYQNGVANPDVLYFGSGNTVYARTTTGGAVVATAALPGATTIQNVVMNPADWANVLATDNSHVFMTTNAGTSWSDITGSLISSGLSSTQLYGLAFIPGASPYVAVGSRSGVYASLLANLGTWTKLGASLPDVPIYSLVYDAKDDLLAAGSLGRGAWLLRPASTAFVPSNVAPQLTLNGPATANEGATEYSYSFTVNDPGDRFTVSGPTISGGSLVAGSLVTTASGGSFKVTFPDGPATATISLQVTDSTGLTSNTASTNVTVANVIPSSVTINGAPASPVAGTLINLTNTVIDPSPDDQAAGFTYLWFVYKPTGAAAIANGSGAAYSFTPSIAGTYTVYLNATDKNGGVRQGSKVINVTAAVLAAAAAAAPTALQAQVATDVAARSQLQTVDQTTAPLSIAAANLTANASTVTVVEGQVAENAGTYANTNGNPVTLSASVGTLTQVPQISCETPLSNLVSWWHAEGNANDGVGSNHGTLQNGAGFATGIVGQAFSFDGINDFVNIPSNASIDLRNNVTVMAWFKVNSLAAGSFAKVLSKRNAAADYAPFEISLAYNGVDLLVGSQGSTTGSSWDVGIVSQPLTFGAWYHVAFVMDGNNLHTFYLNGQAQGTQQLAAPLKASTGDAFTIGTSARGFPFNGLVDEVEIVNRALSASEIQAIYTNCPAPAIAGTWSWSYNTNDGPAQNQDVTITATDNVNNQVTTLPFTLVVENAPPGATLGNNGPVNEGSTATVSFSDQADPSTADTTAGLRYAYDFDNDGVFELGGDGTYANAVTSASATVPASFLTEGPGTRTVLGRIIDTDGGYTDYTTDITINNVAPTASVSGPATALASQLATFVLKGTDAAAADQAAGFTYSINWGDGSPTESIAPVAGNGDTTAKHAFATTGSYSIQVTAKDKDGATGAAASTSLTVNAMNTANLQSIVSNPGVIYLQPANDAALHSALVAINGLTAPASPVDITILLGAGPYTGVTLNPPNNIVLDLAGNHTADTPGTQITGASPAVTVNGGEVFVQGNGMTTATDSPTILVTGGHLTLGQAEVQESTGANNVAIAVTGGRVDLGMDMVTNINGQGSFFRTYSPDAIGFPGDIDADMVPNIYEANGVRLSATFLSTTVLRSSANPSTSGQAVTFTARIAVEAEEHGAATGTVAFYEGAILLGTGTVNEVGPDVFEATFTTSSLSVGSHTITAVYSGNDVYIGSSATLTQVVTTPVNHAPTAQNQAVSTNQNTPVAITLVATDADNDPLAYSIITQPAHGALSGTAPNLTYTPASGYLGSDSFTFKANDGKVDSNVATVSLTVNLGNHAPQAVNDTYSTQAKTTLTIAAPGVLSNDSDVDNNPLTAVKVTNPAHGTVTLNANGSFTYVPAANYTGADSFTYKASDGSLTSNVATVNLTVNGKVTAQIQQVSFRITSATTTPDATYPAQSTKGVAVLTLVAKNLGVGLRNVSFRVVKLTQNNYLLNADGSPGREGSKLSVPNSALPGGNQAWDKNELLTQAFRIGLMSRSSFVFQLDVYATKLAVDAADANPTGAEEIEELVGTFTIEIDPNAPTTQGNTIYLPRVNK